MRRLDQASVDAGASWLERILLNRLASHWHRPGIFIDMRQTDAVDGTQQVSKRSRLFVGIPLLAFVVSCCNLIWEIVRLNIDDDLRANWPYRLSLLPIEASATGAVALGGLMLARAQFARTQRPTLGFAVASTEEKYDDPHSDQWGIYLYNAGPGMAVTLRSGYRAVFQGPADTSQDTGWLNASEMRGALESVGLEPGADFWLQSFGNGAPLVPVDRARNGFMVARFSRRATAYLRTLHFTIEVVDTVGDQHERTIEYVSHLPFTTGGSQPDDPDTSDRTFGKHTDPVNSTDNGNSH